MSYKTKPHVSGALAHLRVGVSGAATVVALCAAVQLLIFGFVHFTQVRWAERQHVAAPISVVSPKFAAAPVTSATANVPPGGTAPTSGFTPGAAPKLPSGWDVWMHLISDMNASIATTAAVLLAAFSVMGAMVAGGSSVPGVQRAVSAATWALLLAAVAVPWNDLFPSLLFKGAFQDYGAMTAMSEAVDGGGGSAGALFATFLLAPVAVLCAALLVMGRFRDGVRQGVIATTVSELEEKLEREMVGIRVGGVTGPNVRAVAALNTAIGDTPDDPPPRVPSDAGGIDAEVPGLPKKRALGRLRGLSGEEGDRRPI